ncbi:hypothetical protein E7744_03810 [Citricoccus sp. SGAir0253]|uniref:hypothetical protein n=1 Tax=Citricoccus sp. SGAir0253 TaxID=2567881 RepID=UPI0010CCEED6|nr:hypothetical protein [Citricoccus sp. SGAir0253]QCU77435.1 hypothetical protein E7744_03810 [Citricoccus sp. SGAir0253]
MKHPLLAATAVLAALAAAAGALGAVAAAAAGAALVTAVALGWPQMLGAPARRSLTTVLLATGLLATAGVATWPDPETGGAARAFGGSLLEPVAICLALGTVAAFMVQLVRGSGRPHRLESTAGTVTGVATVGAAAGWTVLARLDAGPLILSVALSLALAALAGLVRLPRPAAAPVALGLAGLAPLGLAAVLPGLAPSHAVVSGLLAGLLVVLTGRTAPDRGRGRPVGNRAAVALGVAPVAVAGVLAYFVFRIVPA